MKYLNLIFIMMLSCCSHFNKKDHYFVNRQVCNNFVKKFATLDGMELFGYGSWSGESIQMFDLTFRTVDCPNIDKARKRLVYLVENFLYFVNSSEAVEFLDKFPCDESKIFFSIGFVDHRGKRVEPPYIAHVSIYKSQVRYAEYNSLEGIFERESSESYAEAYEKVMGIPYSERNLLDFRCTCRDSIHKNEISK